MTMSVGTVFPILGRVMMMMMMVVLAMQLALTGCDSRQKTRYNQQRFEEVFLGGTPDSPPTSLDSIHVYLNPDRGLLEETELEKTSEEQWRFEGAEMVRLRERFHARNASNAQMPSSGGTHYHVVVHFKDGELATGQFTEHPGGKTRGQGMNALWMVDASMAEFLQSTEGAAK